MKRIIISLLTALTFVSVNAQRQMLVHKTDGSTTTISVDKVSKVYFQDNQEDTRDMLVQYNEKWWMNNSFIVDYSFGADISTYKVLVFPETSSYVNYSLDELLPIIESQHSSSRDDNIVCSSNDLKENTTYHFKLLPYDSKGKSGNVVYTLEVTTSSSFGQPRAQISNLTHNSTKWTWYVQMNSYCKAFIQVMYEPSNYINDCDAFLAYMIRKNDNIFLGDGKISSDYWMDESCSYSATYQNPQCEVVTWGLSKEYQLSEVLDRASYGYNSAKSLYVKDTSETVSTRSLSSEDLKHDCSIIKIVKE